MTDGDRHGISKRKNGIEKNVGNWVSLNLGNASVYGMVKAVNGREVVFNPYRAIRYNKEKDCNLHTFVEGDSFLELSSYGYYLEPTNKETLDYYTKKQNEDILENKEKEDLENILKTPVIKNKKEKLGAKALKNFKYLFSKKKS
jgi:hypothetical protein